MLPEFDRDKYFTSNTDRLLEAKHQEYVKLNHAGSRLMMEYYRKRFGTEMEFYESGILRFIADSTKKLAEVRAKKLSRCVFIVADDAHSMPIAYVKEGGREAWISADDYIPNVIDAENLSYNTSLPVYFIEESRQFDGYSCHSEALIFGKEISGRKDEKFKTPDLLEFLAANSKYKAGGVFEIKKLPSRLLKTWQGEGFEKFLTKSDEPVRKAEKWSDFREKTVRFDEAKKKPLNHYLREKGINFGRMIEAEFYSEELAKIHGDKWSPEVELQFLRKAHNAENIREFAQKFEERINLEDLREGIAAGAGSAR